MALVTGPLMSMEASGSIGGTLTFSKWKGRAYVRERVIPANPRSANQVGIRAMIKFLGSVWGDLTALIQSSYETAAAAASISPFNQYMKENMNLWVDGYAPKQTKDATPTHSGQALTTMTPTGGDNHVSLALAIASATNQWAIAIYRDDAEITDASRANCIAIIPVAAQTSLTYVDGGLAPGTYHYRAATITDDGNFGTVHADANATVT
jgi:hypothetical protein